MNDFQRMLIEKCGLTSSFAQKMTGSKIVKGEHRLTLFDQDIFEWANEQCFDKCLIRKPSDMRIGASCEINECECIIAEIYLAVMKLGLIEDKCEE